MRLEEACRVQGPSLLFEYTVVDLREPRLASDVFRFVLRTRDAERKLPFGNAHRGVYLAIISIVSLC